MYTLLIIHHALNSGKPGTSNLDNRSEEKRRIVFARSDAKCIGSENYLQGSYKPDIILVKWNVFKDVHGCGTACSESYKSYICCESGRDKPDLSWCSILFAVEVKRGGFRGVSKGGNR